MSVLPFLNIIERLKTTKRTGWLNENISHPESIADHMYRMSIITMLCTDSSLDKDRMMRIALIHDMAEALVGDITPLDNIPKETKRQMELDAMHTIKNALGPSYTLAAEEMLHLFLEYEERASPEARFVKDVDKFELVVQTFEYERAGRVGRRLNHFIASEASIAHPLVRKWCDEVLRERETWWAKQANGHAESGSDS